MMRQLFLFCARFLFAALPRAYRLRDFIMWPMATRVLGMDYYATVRTNGIALRVGLDDYLTRLLMFFGDRTDYVWEPSTTRLAQMLAKDARVSVVAGGHVGYTALMVRKAMTRPGSALYTFEPIKSLYQIGQENYDMNRSLGEIVHEQLCLSRDVGTASMEARASQSAVVDPGTYDPRHLVTVQTTSLDAYAKEKNLGPIDFALFDVEGYEDAVLEGMHGLLVQSQPTHIILEYSIKIQRDEHHMNTYLDRLRPFGYTLYIIHDDYEHRDMRQFHHEPLTLSLLNDQNIKKFLMRSYFNVLATKSTPEMIVRGLRKYELLRIYE